MLLADVFFDVRMFGEFTRVLVCNHWSNEILYRWLYPYTAAACAPPRHDQRSWFQWRDKVSEHGWCQWQCVRTSTQEFFVSVMWRIKSLVGTFWSWSHKTSTLRWSTITRTNLLALSTFYSSFARRLIANNSRNIEAASEVSTFHSSRPLLWKKTSNASYRTILQSGNWYATS